MKLLENIVNSIPREKIPHSVEFFAQNWKGKDEKVMCFLDKPHKGMIGWERGCYLQKESLDVGKTSEDAATTIITREELMRAYDLVEQGYTLWFGGDCPVDGSTLVDVALRDYPQPETNYAKKVEWSDDGISEDVIAYKISNVKKHIFPEPIKNVEVKMSSEIKMYGSFTLSGAESLMRDISNSMPEMMAADMVELADYLIAQGWGKHE